MNLRLSASLVVLSAVLLAGCTDKLRDTFDPDTKDPIDKQLELSREDYRNMGAPKLTEPEASLELLNPNSAPPLPDFAELLAAPRPPKIEESQLVSIAVTDDVPLKDVLLELARLAEIDIELDSGITGGVSFIARDKPFNQVIDRIANLAGLRYQMQDGVLRIERDLPYIESYPIDFLNVDRNSSNTSNITTGVLTGGGEDGPGLTTGSSTSIDSTSVGDFWNALEAGVQQILAYEPARRTSQNTLVTVDSEGAIRAVTGSGGAVAETEAGTVVAGEEAVETAVTTAEGARAQRIGDGFYILNRQAGLLTVSASDRQQEMLRQFITKIRRNATSQVLIEAKIVEITLNDRFQSGVDWSALIDNKLGIRLDFSNIDPTSGIFTISLDDNVIDGLGENVAGAPAADLNDLIQLTQTFGTTRTLSSPRLLAINNQQALLTFAENLVYFELSIEREETDSDLGGSRNELTIDSEVKTIPIGILLTMQPSVNLDTNDVTLQVRPTLSRVTGFVNDPAVAYLAQLEGVSLQNQVPIVEVRELDSILKLRSGEVMVIGGLMEQGSVNNESGVPFISEVPYIGNLFKGVDRQESSRELVIFIKATIVGSTGFSQPADRVIYDKFTDDPRPLAF